MCLERLTVHGVDLVALPSLDEAFRFADVVVVLPLTTEAGDPAENNVYAQRIALLEDPDFRNDMLHRLRRR